MRLSLVFSFFCLCLFGGASFGVDSSIDLRNEDWSQGKIHTLGGKWEFYPQQFVFPDQFPLEKDDFIHAERIPALLSLNDLPVMGYGTFKINVRVPKGSSELFLFIPDIAKAFKLWNNGKLVEMNGLPGIDKESEKPGFQSKIVAISPDNGVISLVLQLSNFHYQWAGTLSPFQLTDKAGVFELKEKKLIQAAVISTILIVAGILCLLLFLSRSKQKLLLFFGLLCLDMGLRRLLIDERILYFFVGEHWRFLQGLENISTYLAFPLFISYFSYRFPLKYSRHASLLSWLVATPFCLMALSADVDVYTRYNAVFQMIILFSLPYIFFVYAKVVYQKREGLVLFGIGLVFFSMAIVSDILTYNHLIDMPFLAHTGILVFVLFQLLDLIKNYLSKIKTIEDMSLSLRRKNKELLKIDAFKDDFLSTTSHELRTPLLGISGLANTLSKDDSLILSQQQQHSLDLIASTGQRLGSLVNDILDFSSIKHEALTLDFKTVDLKTVANRVISTLEPLLAGKDVLLAANISSDARYVRADENRLQQILFNLLGNAVKFTDEGFIQLNATSTLNSVSGNGKENPKSDVFNKQGKVRIEILDSGIGIPLDKRDGLFEPFSYTTESNSSPYSGSGLGLSITRQLIQQHGSDIDIQSTEGEGTSVKFSLEHVLNNNDTNTVQEPEHPDNLEMMSIQKYAVETSDKFPKVGVQNDYKAKTVEGAHIFVVDDEEINLQLVNAQLSAVGYTVEGFSSGKAILERLDDFTPDLIVLDLMMPNINGIEVCEIVRQTYDSYEIPIMMLTARYQVNDIVDCLNAGANDYLVKPHHETELLARVCSQLDARKFWRSHQENQELKKEIEQRKKLEKELYVSNVRLLQALDITEERIVLLSPSLNVLYANQPAAHYFQHLQGKLLGSSLSEILDEKLADKLMAMIQTEGDSFSVSIVEQVLGEKVTMTLRSFEEKNEHFFALIISRPDLNDNPPAALSHNLIQDLTQELYENRSKFEKIEQALKRISTFHQEDGKKPGLSDENRHSGIDVTYKRALLVRLFSTTLSAWERHTQRTKFDLAEESRYWRVYLDGTTAKTRTMDRYLSETSLPQKPRWQLVVRTAQYVIDNCLLPEEELEVLTEMLHEVNKAYS